jgi:cytochrome b subunit of formate dehydrogenase
MKYKAFSRAVLVVVLLLASSGCWRRKVAPPRNDASTRAGEEQVLHPEPLERVPLNAEKIRAALGGSVHAKLDCSACHDAADKRERAGDVGIGQCTSCHADQAKLYAESVHGKAAAKGSEAATCTSCHGIHEVKRANDVTSPVAKQNLPRTCGNCHANAALAKKLGIKAPSAERQYFESIHGKALLVQGLSVAPACGNCHGKAHQIFAAADSRSTVNRFNVAATCGTCHTGERDKYADSVHGASLRAESPAGGGHSVQNANVAEGKKAPTCPDCHSAHEIREKGAGFALANDKICGDCHQERLRRYLDTYHGRAHDLGDVEVASCSSCHGSHAIYPSTNPASMMSEQNKQATCQTCHPGSSKNFSEYLAHADHDDRAHYPGLYWTFIAMTGLLLGTFGFFGLHSVLWLGRTLVFRWRDPEAFRETKLRSRKEEGAKLYARFRPVDRLVHFLVIVSFTLLVATGMPLKFHGTAWAHQFFDAFGGAATARAVHRFAAIVTFAYFAIHIASLRTLIKSRSAQYHDAKGRFRLGAFLGIAFGPDSPFPRLQDVKDLAGHMKWFFGLGPRPRFDRFTYWEKFDYMAVFWGVTMIGLSGLIMWFPEAFTLVLPGWAINVALVIHSDEALLAAGFIFTFHFYNSHFRPEKFPFDSVMFSGHQTEEELRDERPALYERMEKAGELEKYETLGEWRGWKPITTVFGSVAIAIGLALSALIFWAVFR